VSQKTTTVCDECGTTAEARSGGFGWTSPMGWLTVSGLGPVISADLPHEYRAKQPDLCSWKCVAAYAAKRAGIEVPS
jgi:hypothetical protein